jgi:hypothetical protein
MRPRMKPLWGRLVVLALLLILAISLTLACTSGYPKKYQLGFLSTSQRTSKCGWIIEHDLFGGTSQSIVREDWEDD